MLGAALVHAGIDVQVEGWSTVPGEADPVGGPLTARGSASARLVAGPPALALGRGERTISRTAPVGGLQPGAVTNLYGAADRLWVPTVAAAVEFAAAGIDPVRLTVVPTPVEADRFSPSVPPL